MMREVAATSAIWQQQFRKNRLLAAFFFDADDTSVLAEAPRLVHFAPAARVRHQAEALLLLAHAHRGDDNAALAVAGEMRALTDGDPTGEALGRWALGEAHWLAGRADLAFDVAQTAADLPVVGFPGHVLAATVAAWAAIDTGRPITAPAPACAFANLAGAVSEYEGLAAIASAPAEAALRLEAAAAEWERLSPRHALRARLGQAHALLASGARTDAVACLLSVEEHARKLGSVPLERRARAGLRRAGERPMHERRATGSRLSPTEFVVLDLVGRGLTSHQIARRLWISGATVESHVNNARRALNASTRMQAAVAAMAERRRGPEHGRFTITNDLATYRRIRDEWRTSHGRIVDLGTDARVRKGDYAAACVEDLAGAARVVSAAGPCAAVVVHLGDEVDAPLAAALREALEQVGNVRDLGAHPASVTLAPELRALLEDLAAGHSVGEIAARHHVSRRTIERQMKRARDALGVSTNAEAVTRACSTA